MNNIPSNQDLNIQEAQNAFVKLIEENRATALWFLTPSINMNIRDNQADHILDSIAQKGNRSTWIQARKLKKWRLQHIK